MNNLKSFLYFHKILGYKFMDDSFLNVGNFTKFNNINLLQKTISSCNLCNLCKTRKNIIFDKKNSAKIMLIFDFPSILQDESGEIFVGNVWIWLENLLKEIFNETEIYTSFLVKCKMSQNLELNSEILLKCSPYLFDEIDLIMPNFIITFGDFVSKFVLYNENLPSLELSHGSIFKRGNSFVMPVFSLQFLSKNPSKNSVFLQDLKKIKELL